ncbi:hypothetical protein EDD53_1162 [Pacificibacter maritimus]|uniref:Dihydroorotate dehydrogenase n=1 Tax=Pacificibacter maritimus TaxID=762213 RepID=A0A3N4UNL2_9RHOB|nr:hypothetical protein [Pacificibacter maritimus]RPE72023.1 hypothetical protein EDD53_1162 [Pacificibacter maritimus]
MTQRDDLLGDADLDVLFDAARAEVARPSDSFMARVLADADAVQDSLGAGLPDWAKSPQTAAAPSIMNRLLDLIGGWRGGAGLATATVMGLAFGLGAPNTVSQVATGNWSSAAISTDTQMQVSTAQYVLDDLVPSFFDLAAEG